MSTKIRGDQPDGRFFKESPAYVVLYPEADGELRVASEITEQGVAVLTFAAMFDAVIEVTHRSRLGGTYVFERADHINPFQFLDRRGKGFVTDVRLGWPARDGRILLRSSGAFAGCSRLMWHPEPKGLAFEFDADILDEYSRLREMAGLYAWQETDAEIRRTWHEGHVIALAQRAVELVEVTEGDGKDFNQLAFFDPEFEQWHYVPHP